MKQFAKASALVAFFISINSIAIPLTEEAVRRSKRVVFFTGTFDPITKSHMEVAELAVKTGVDLVVVTPNPTALHKSASQFDIRAKMIESVYKDHPKVAYIEEGPFSKIFKESSSLSNYKRELFKAMRGINPHASFGLVAGTDVVSKKLHVQSVKSFIKPDEWIISMRKGHELALGDTFAGKPVTQISGDVNISSTEVRKYLWNNMDIYFDPSFDRTEIHKMIHPKALEIIINNGLFLGKDPNTTVSPLKLAQQIFKKSLYDWLNKLGLFDLYKELMIKWNHAKKESTIDANTLGDKSFRVVKKLGIGSTATAYLIEVGGKQFVLKHAHQKESRVQAVRNSIPVHLWLNQVKEIPSPKLFDYDPSGKWMLTEYIEGTSLKEKLQSGVSLSETELSSLRKLFEQGNSLYKNSTMTLDLAADNIIFRNGKVVLIDLGLIPFGSEPESFEKQVKMWARTYSNNRFLDQVRNYQNKGHSCRGAL